MYTIHTNVVLGAEFVSRSTVLYLKSNDVVTINVKNKDVNRQSHKLKILVNGFLYNPSHKSPVVWSVHSTTKVPPSDSAMDEQSLACKNEKLICKDVNLYFCCAMVSVFTFDKVTVNLGNVWSTLTNEAIIPFNGLYYVTFVLLLSKCNMMAILFVNEEATTSIRRLFQCVTVTSLSTRERAVLLNLRKYDKVSVKIINGSVATFTDGSVASFAGLFLYPL